MKKVAVKSVAMAALLAVASSPAFAAEATLGVDVNSAYVFRGTTWNDGFVAQPYLEVSGLPIDIGVWGNFDIEDFGGNVAKREFSEVDFYASYTLPVEGIESAIGYTEYTYPNIVQDADREVSLSLGLDTLLAPSLGFFYTVDGVAEEDFYADFSIGHDVELTEDVSLNLGALIGYLYPEEGKDGFNQYELSASLAWKFITLGATYIGQVDDEVLTDAVTLEDGTLAYGYDVEWLFTLGLSHSF